MKQSFGLKQSQNLALTPQLQQSIRLLQLSALELEQEILQAAEENPLLEFDSSLDEEAYEPIAQLSHRSIASNKSSADSEGEEDRFARLASHTSLLDHLLGQIQLLRLNTQEKALVGLLAGSLDEKGYLNDSLENFIPEVLDFLDPEDGTPLEQLERALSYLQHLDPIGVGARDLGECLSLQIRHGHLLNNRVQQLALQICQHHISSLAQKDWTKLKRQFKVHQSELDAAVAFIKTLNPNPGIAFDTANENYIIPEVIVKKIKGIWRALPNPAAMPKIKIHDEYAQILGASKNKDNSEGIQQKLQEARWLVKNVLQRSETILKVANAIVDRQQNFFNHGEVAMRPMVLKEIADTVGMHESTISRVTTQKYLASNLGTFEFKYFFGSQISTDSGGSVSSTAIRALITHMVSSENPDNPLSDSKIADLLADKGYVVARRTIAKYRESLRIPAVHLRRK
jgi:RNA polymerase sigma-54 factor